MRGIVITATAAAVVVVYLSGVPVALAAPMLCSGEQKNCIAACQNKPRALVGDCIANCRARTNYCKQTGCWDDGSKRYCGLGRQ
jgi:hypothetical protein